MIGRARLRRTEGRAGGGVGLDEIQQGRGEFAIGAAQVRHDGGVIVSRHLDDARHPPGGGHARRVLQRVEIQVGIFVFRHGDHEGHGHGLGVRHGRVASLLRRVRAVVGHHAGSVRVAGQGIGIQAGTDQGSGRHALRLALVAGIRQEGGDMAATGRMAEQHDAFRVPAPGGRVLA